MRWIVALVLLLAPALALARPEVALAPLEGDAGGKVISVVAELARGSARVVGPDRVRRTMGAEGVDRVTRDSARTLRKSLGVDVVVFGTVEKKGKRRELSLFFAGRGKTARIKLVVDFASVKELRDELRGTLATRIQDAASAADDDDDTRSSPFKRGDDEDRERKRRDDEDRERKRRDDEDRERKRRDDETRERERKRREDAEARRDEDRRRRRDRDDRDDRADRDGRDRERRRRDRDRRVADADVRADRARDDEIDPGDDAEDDDRGRRRRRGMRGRHPLTQAALWLDAGALVARRTLTYDASGAMRPPRVGTAAAAGRLEGEVYPAALTGGRGVAAGFGLALAVDRAVGLGIDVPNTTVTAPIQSGHYGIGARYRLVTGRSAIAFGLGYWRSYYKADRSGLMDPDDLDMPDVDYTALAPSVAGRLGLSPTLSAFGSVEVPLVLSSGPIQDGASYGSARIVAFGVRTGIQLALGRHYALQVAAELDQVGLTFTQREGSLSATRGVRAATDRSLGIAATLGIMY